MAVLLQMYWQTRHPPGSSWSTGCQPEHLRSFNTATAELLARVFLKCLIELEASSISLQRLPVLAAACSIHYY